MIVPSVCPLCGEAYRWELSLRVERELAWRAPHGPAFVFRCGACAGLLEVGFRWHLEQGRAPRPLTLAGGPTRPREPPAILLVDRCPHGCSAELGLRLEPDDPWASATVWPDEDRVLGGYRCPTCDGEGRLRIRPVVAPFEGDPAAVT